MVILPILGVLAVLYWLAAPDPVTAGTRTAAGTAAKAAGSGIGQHWADGRGQRQARRTDRRKRWGKGRGNGWQRIGLGLDKAAVWTWGAGKTLAGVTAAAVRPVPAALGSGWEQGRDKHRAKAGSRPVPIAMDLPLRRREQPQVQAGEQPAEQVQVQAGNSPEVQPGNSSDTESGLDWRRREDRLSGQPGAFLHVSRAKLKPGDHVIPGARLPDKATSQGHAWYTSQGPEVAWRMGRVWLWPSLAQARKWMDVDDKAIYEVRPVDPKPLDCCSHTSPDPDCETGGDCGYGQQWHAADAVVTRVVQRRKLIDAVQSLSPFGRRPTEWTGLGPDGGDGDRPDIWRDPAPTGGTARQAAGGERLQRRRCTRCGHVTSLVVYRGDEVICPRCRRPEDDDFRGECHGTVQAMVRSPTAGPYWLGPGGVPTRSFDAGPLVQSEVRCSNTATGPDGMCDEHRNPTDQPAGTSPAGSTTPTEGAPVSSPVSFELRNLVNAEGFARHIDALGEGSDFVLVAEKAAVMGDKLRGGGFGREMDTAVDGLEESARRFAADVTVLRQCAADLAGTAVNVRGA